ncbi:MAG: MBL fold metallo-hydrolase [Deltaproteobacteria bacterium]|nr:MBL fold metallo-hydrolase [Deltaproteobacteria bacterium]
MIFRQLFDKESSTYTYLLGDPSSGEAALIDPVLEQLERDLKVVAELGLKLTVVLDTHVHADHVTAAGALRARTGARTHFSATGGPECADVLLADGDEIGLGATRIQALATPGHTNTCMSYVWGGRVFTGDALLVRGCGRTDFQEGDAARLWRSVHEKLFTLPDDTAVYPAHDYRGHTSSSIAEEKRHNPRLGGAATEASFVELMSNLDLPPPAKIHEAVPANRACGQRP